MTTTLIRCPYCGMLASIDSGALVAAREFACTHCKKIAALDLAVRANPGLAGVLETLREKRRCRPGGPDGSSC